MTRVCVDAMGGDEPPEIVLQGIEKALVQDSDLELLVAGLPEVVEPFCESHERAFALAATEVIDMADHPAEAVRTKRDSSIVKGCQAVRAGEAEGFFSAGSTGAILAAGTLHVGRSRGIKRPAIAVALPGIEGHSCILLDVGANADCRPEMIVQFAEMGRAYSQVLFGTYNPKIALLSNGTEETKGSSQVLEFHEALASSGLNFVGNCEGPDLLLNPDIDVAVCDGFTGNVALKTLEGTAKYLLHEIKGLAHSSKRAGLGGILLKPSLGGLKDKLSGDKYGGAMLLGLKAPVLVGHGATSVEAICNGCLASASMVRGGIVEKISVSSPRRSSE
ncbi:MAG: phosphate acyltransferase PlsX [Atopobiaceae bacterium]|nr:phosphate acyltransferase PlsX [Atopobiaceae bacterium]